MLAFEYGGNARLASGGVFITTLLSVVTIPLLMRLLLS
jgi:predicted permease